MKNSIVQESKRYVQVGSNAWIICNADSSFYKSDTITLNNNINYYYQSNLCCEFINWTFYRKTSFIQSVSQICREPASSRPIKHDDHYKIRIEKIGEEIFLEVFRNETLIQNYKVVSYESLKTPISKESNNRLILVRI